MTGGRCWTKNNQPKKRYERRRDAKNARRWAIDQLGDAS